MGISWTDEQKSVINSRHGNLLVSAAAGSGKTAVLVERILEMVMGVDADGNKAEEKIDIDEVLVVTFTRAAPISLSRQPKNIRRMSISLSSYPCCHGQIL